MKNKSLKSLLSLKNKVSLVIGGSGYLGTAICETFAELGSNVIIASRDEEKCIKLSNKLKKEYNVNCEGFGVDITKEDEVSKLLVHIKSNFGKLDVLVNNAWSGKKNSFDSITFDDWDYDIELSLNAVFKTIKLAVPFLEKSNGVIINTSSMYGHVAPDYRIYDGDKFANPPSYGSAKAGVIQLTKYLSSFLSPKNIRVNSVSPGPFPFPETMKNEKFINNLISKTILGRVGVPDDLKGVYGLLASDASKYITGQNFCIDGGWAVW